MSSCSRCVAAEAAATHGDSVPPGEVNAQRRPSHVLLCVQCGNPHDRVCPAMGTLLAQLKVHVTSAAATAKMDCKRVQLSRKLVTLLGGEHVRASSCDICVLVSPHAPKKEQSSAQLSVRNGTGRRLRQTGACKNQEDLRKLGLSSDAVVVADSWLKDTIEKQQRQPYTEHAM